MNLKGLVSFPESESRLVLEKTINESAKLKNMQ